MDAQDVVFSGQIRLDEPVTIQVGIHVANEDSPLEEIMVLGIIDIGSKQCVVNAGVFDEEVFIQEKDSSIGDGIGRRFDSRCREMAVRLMRNGNVKRFRIPVYEMTLGLFSHGARAMLIGRTILNQGILVYDGMNQKWSMTFPGD